MDQDTRRYFMVGGAKRQHVKSNTYFKKGNKLELSKRALKSACKSRAEIAV